ncbi:MAG: hypothetical protein ABIA62_07705 [Candidatus Woesearchaeota archaeon]
MGDSENLDLTFEKVTRVTKDGDIVKDLKEGYLHFEAKLDANGKKLTISKRVRLDKPERMLNKFVTKVKALAEEKYKEQKYYVANKKPPAIDVHLVNEEDVNDKLLLVFEEVGQYMRSKNIAVMATASVKF